MGRCFNRQSVLKLPSALYGAFLPLSINGVDLFVGTAADKKVLRLTVNGNKKTRSRRASSMLASLKRF
jgi:hypothetical protein